MAKIIIGALPIPGELSPMLRLARGLAGRGHRITVVTGNRFRVDVEDAGLAFVPVTGPADYDISLRTDSPERAKLTPGPEMLNYDSVHNFVNPIPDLHAVLQRLLAEDPDQYLISNAQWLGALPTALGVPGLRPRRWVAVSAIPLFLSSDDTTFFGPVPAGPGEDGKAANRAANAQFAAAMQPTQDRLAEVLRSLGATQECPVFTDAISTVPDVTAALTVPGFEFERSDAPDSVHLVGILPARAADGWQPQPIPFAEAVPLILAADRRAGPVISGEFEQLFDPKNARVDWCRAKTCDDTGFSVGTVGATTGLFYGGFDGSTNAVRAVAHEAGHAIHRQFMAEHQPIAAYNGGPKFMSESFAIFNELLLLDHLGRSAATPAAQAYYLRRFLDDATFQVFGSAEETALEETLHADIAAGKARTAADLDARTLATLAAFTPRPLMADETKAYWARNKLYFIDPFYDVNYLFAGLLALDYLRQFERDPQDFERRYVALQGNGFDDTAAVLLKRFMQIDIDDPDALVRGATGLIATRSATLAALYAR